MSYSEPRAVASLAALYIFRMLGLFMVLPVLALSGADYQGSNTFLLGVALGIYGLTQALLQIPFGMLSDRFGRKPLIFIGLLLFAVGSVIAASAESVTGLIIGRACQGAGAIAGVVMAMVGDVTSPQNRTKAMAAIGASIGLAFSLSLILGPWLAGVTLFDISGVRLLFWLTTLLSVVGVAVLLWLVPTPAVTDTPQLLSLSGLLSVLQQRQYACLYFGVFALHYALMAFFVVVPLLLEQVGILKEQHSWVYLGAMLVSFVVMIPLMLIGERKQRVKELLCIALVAIVIALLMLAYLPVSASYTIACLLLFFTGFNYLEANLPSLLTKLLPQQNRGAGSGVFATCQFLGAALGGIAGGWFYTRWGIEAAFGSSILALLLWLVILPTLVMPVSTRGAEAEIAGFGEHSKS